MKDIYVGLDFGTTHTTLSYYDEKEKKLRELEDFCADVHISSAIYFSERDICIGEVARMELLLSEQQGATCFKSALGDENIRYPIGKEEYSAEAIAAKYLWGVKKIVEDANEVRIQGAVLAMPAYYGSVQKAAMLRAANCAEFKVLGTIPDPLAAALAYYPEGCQKTVLVYDLGGGSFDCSVVKIDGKVSRILNTYGDHQLGGMDWDNVIVNLILEKFCAATGCDEYEMREDIEFSVWLRENVEKYRKILTVKDQTNITVRFGGQKQRIEITRKEFEEASANLLERTVLLIRMMEREGVSIADDVDEILLVGGASRMPQVYEYLTQEFCKPILSVEPQSAVARGAALYAEMLLAAQNAEID